MVFAAASRAAAFERDLGAKAGALEVEWTDTNAGDPNGCRLAAWRRSMPCQTNHALITHNRHTTTQMIRRIRMAKQSITMAQLHSNARWNWHATGSLGAAVAATGRHAFSILHLFFKIIHLAAAGCASSNFLSKFHQSEPTYVGCYFSTTYQAFHKHREAFGLRRFSAAFAPG